MAFEPAPLLIGLREGLEVLLVVGILFGMLNRLGANDRRPLVWIGFSAGIVASLGLGLIINFVFFDAFENGPGAAAFEVIVALIAVGVLTYMVLWMQRNARHMAKALEGQVQAAIASKHIWALVLLGFFTVLREGVEVVLFYTALNSTIAWLDIAIWGVVGFAISAAIAYAIFRLTVNVPLHRFFAISGMLLILIAAGLLVHVVHAAAELGWIGHAAALWDTSGIMPDEDHWLGGPLHALIGYEDQPTLLQLVLYLGYLVGVGGFYLAGLASETKRPAAMRRSVFAVVAVLAVLSVGAAIPTEDDPNAPLHGGHGNSLYADDAIPAHLDHKAITANATALLEESDARVAVWIRSHGEPVHYNASTYQSFKQFIIDIWPYTGLPEELLSVDQGTYYIDNADPHGATDLSNGLPGQLVDAWLDDGPLMAVPVTDPMGLGAASDATAFAGGDFYFTSGTGSGVGEGDLFEMLGLSSYRVWLKMENESPKYEQTKDHFAWMDKHLANHFGDRVKAFYAYHIDPFTDPNLNLQESAQAIADWNPDVVLDSYHSSVHSDAMNGCMMQPHARHALSEAGYTGRIVDVGMAGHQRAWGEGVANYLAQNLDHFDENESVSVYLSQHGATPGSESPCRAGQEDPYHANLQEQFRIAGDVIESHFPGRFTLRHVYGQSAADADGSDGFYSPMKALEADKADGIAHAIVIPYEFWSDAMDNLVPLRESFGMSVESAPYYDPNYETHLTIDGMHVDIWSAHYGVEEKGTAHLAAISAALEQALA